MGRLPRDEAPVGRDGLAQIAVLRMDPGQAEKGLDMLRLQMKRFSVARERELGLALRLPHLPEIEMSLCVSRVDFDSTRNEIRRSPVVARRISEHADQVQRVPVFRVLCQTRPAPPLGLGALARLARTERPLEGRT